MSRKTLWRCAIRDRTFLARRRADMLESEPHRQRILQQYAAASHALAAANRAPRTNAARPGEGK